MQIDQVINEAVTPLADILSGIIFFSVPLVEGVSLPLILVLLVSIGLFSTFYFGFINVRYFKRGVGLATGRVTHPEDAKAEGDITPFQALATTLSGTVGLGNIAGVAVAISIGGAGAVFWMVLMRLFSMSTKFLEASLGVKYRIKNQHGDLSGGPMYYLRDGLRELGWPKLGMVLAVIFAICSIGGAFGAGNMFQVNQVHQQLVNVTGGNEVSYWADKGWLFGLGIAVLVGAVIIGGIKSIANVAAKIVPTMAIIYLISGFIVIGVNYTEIPTALSTIITSAFSLEAGLGGLVGAIIQGVRRAAFSNEAGIGSAAVAHSVAKTPFPVAQGMVAMLGAFADTVIICLMTALVILLSGVPLTSEAGIEGVTLTSSAFETVMPWYPYVLAFVVFLFAYSTMLTWSYIGSKGIEFLLGDNYYIDLAYKIIFCLVIIVGASASLDVIIELSDAMYFAMAIPNIIGLYILAPKIKAELKKYKQHILNYK
jgi:AGCS family alanine or glycine:cation symporter